MEFTYLSMCDGIGALFVYVHACVYVFIHAEVRGQSCMSSPRPIYFSFARFILNFNVCVYVYGACVDAHRGPKRALDPSHAPQPEARVIGSCE